MMRFSFSVVGDVKRTRRHPESNGVDVFYKFQGGSTPVPPPPTPVTADSEPPSGEPTANTSGLPTSGGYETSFSTRARFTSQLSLDDIGKTLHVYARWANTSDRVKSGPFSMVSTVVVS